MKNLIIIKLKELEVLKDRAILKLKALCVVHKAYLKRIAKYTATVAYTTLVVCVVVSVLGAAL